ncbi:MAG TPA: SGNH/GDSL hydrolase family protein [Crinalium sp.]|jgi:phospholipase/lecithinase/hemolysin
MKKQFLTVGVVLTTAFFPLRSLAANFTGLYVFGDSLSDPGNVFNLTKAFTGTGSPPPPYSEGRFSNGQIWTSYFAQDLGLSPVPATTLPFLPVPPTQGINFAFGGATTGPDNTITPLLPGLTQQVETFTTLLQGRPADPNALYVVWAGANDYLPTESKTFTPYTNPKTSIRNLSNTISSLAALGARNFLVANQSNLGQVPIAAIAGDPVALSKLSDRHNARLNKTIQSFERKLPDSTFYLLDIHALFAQAFNGQFGFTNVTVPCISQGAFPTCPGYLFWDQYHPTEAAHQKIADLALQTVNATPTPEPASVPEPASGIALLAFGIASAVTMRRAKAS